VAGPLSRHRHAPQHVALREPKRRVRRAEQLGGPLGKRVEHRLNIG
jgi:hypothetical protein